MTVVVVLGSRFRGLAEATRYRIMTVSDSVCSVATRCFSSCAAHYLFLRGRLHAIRFVALGDYAYLKFLAAIDLASSFNMLYATS